MRPLLILPVLSLFLLVPASITRAQKVTVSGNVYDKGTVKNTFTTPYGSITTILPDDIRPGDQIMGTVIYEPGGRREKDKSKNKIELLKHSLSVEPGRTGTTGTALAEPMKDVFILQNKPQATMHGGAEHARDIFITELIIPATYAGDNLHVILRDPFKKLVAESSSPVLDISIPDASPFNVRGRYWGYDAGNINPPQEPTRIFVPDKTIYLAGEQALIYSPPAMAKHKSGALVYLNRTRQKELSAQQLELKPLVSTPRQTVVSIPENIYGPAELVFKTADGKIIASEKIHVLQLEASCPKTNLRKGESTVLNVNVNGVKDCPAEYVRLSLDNSNSNSVKMGNSNHEELIIETASPENVFAIQRPVTALQTGSFNIDIALNYPSSVYNDPVRQQSDALKAHADFVNALIQDISFPEMDANNKAHVQVMSVYYPRKGSVGNSPPAQRNWPVNNFRFEMGGLPCKGITKVDALKWESKTAKTYLEVRIPFNESKPWQQWLENKSPRNGGIQYSNDRNESFFTIEFKDAKPVSAVTAPNGDLLFKFDSEKAVSSYSEEILSNMISDLDPGRVLRPEDLVAVFNPFNKKLLYNPGYKSQVFEKMNPRLRADGKYDVSIMTYNRKPINVAIDLVPGSLFELINESKDSIKYDKYGFESTGDLIREHWDSAGSYRFYKNAKCKRWKEPGKGSCTRDVFIDSAGKLVETGKSSITEVTGESHCYKGTEFCTEMYIVAIIVYQYDDANCKKLVNVKTYGGWSCE